MCNFLLNRRSQIAVLMNEKTSKLLPTCTFVYVTRMRSDRMRTTCLLAVSCSAQRVGVCPFPLDVDAPGCRLPGCRSPLDSDLPGCRTHGCRLPDADRWMCAEPPNVDILDADPLLYADPPHAVSLDADLFLDADPPGHVTCDARWKANPPVDRMTDACENITLPQSSFADGNNDGYCLTCKWIFNKQFIKKDTHKLC